VNYASFAKTSLSRRILYFDAVDFNFASAVLAENNFVTNRNAQSSANAIVQAAFLVLLLQPCHVVAFLGRIWQNDTASSGLFCFEWSDNDTVIERTRFTFAMLCFPLL
jgi:hypothetical protein